MSVSASGSGDGAREVGGRTSDVTSPTAGSSAGVPVGQAVGESGASGSSRSSQSASLGVGRLSDALADASLTSNTKGSVFKADQGP